MKNLLLLVCILFCQEILAEYSFEAYLRLLHVSREEAAECAHHLNLSGELAPEYSLKHNVTLRRRINNEVEVGDSGCFIACLWQKSGTMAGSTLDMQTIMFRVNEAHPGNVDTSSQQEILETRRHRERVRGSFGFCRVFKAAVTGLKEERNSDSNSERLQKGTEAHTVSQMVVTIVSPWSPGETMNLFTGKLKISKSLNSTSQELLSFAAWQKLLAAVIVVSVMGFLFWKLHESLAAVTDEKIENVSMNLDVSSKRDTLVTRSEVAQVFGASIEQSVSTSYCKMKDCATISCSSIPRGSDPGAVASSFIETDFKIDCKNTESIKVSFNDCKFPGNALRTNWLRTNVSIEELMLDRCYLREIEDEAFSLPIYEITKKIILSNNDVTSLRRAVFRRLGSLEELSVQENIINEAEYNLLDNVASSLTSLELSGVINDINVLRNITGGSSTLNVQILTLRGNSIPLITRELFEGVPTVKSLYLEYSKVNTVSPGALEPIAPSILQLIINDNSIHSLPVGLLDSILRSNRPFRMAIHNNPWHCECSLKWLQDLIQAQPNIVFAVPVCSNPETNAGESFARVEFCPSNATASSVVNVTTEMSTKQDLNTVTTKQPGTTEKDLLLTCTVSNILLNTKRSHKLLSTDLEIPLRFPDFFVAEIMEDSVLVNLPDLNEGVTLLWFNNNDVDGSPSCAKNVRHSYLVRNIDSGATYTICLLSDNAGIVSPFDCLAVTTILTYQSRTWLSNADKIIVCSLLVASMVLLFLISAFFTFVLIRRHPSLLRGSKRVMLVKRNVDAIVLPKGVNVEEGNRGCGNVAAMNKQQEDGYITPLPPAPLPAPRGRRVSRMSAQSDWNSYVLEVEPTEMQLASWRLHRLNNELELEKPKSETPPLPPHPSDTIPSVSFLVDWKEEHALYEASNI